MPWLEWGHGHLPWRWTISGPEMNVLMVVSAMLEILIDPSDLLTDMVVLDNS